MLLDEDCEHFLQVLTSHFYDFQQVICVIRIWSELAHWQDLILSPVNYDLYIFIGVKFDPKGDVRREGLILMEVKSYVLYKDVISGRHP